MKNRINSIDILRGFAVILMIFGHIYYIWPKINIIMFEEIFPHIFLLAPPFFLIISGMSFYIYVKHMNDKGITKISVFFDVIKRALFIFIISTLIQFIFGFTLDMKIPFIIYWSIFQVIAFSMIISFFILLINNYLRRFTYLISIILIFFMEHIISFYEIKVLFILIKGDAFPLIPWSTYYIFGLVLSEFLYNPPIESIKKLLFIFLYFGLGFLFVWIFWLNSFIYLHITTFFKSIGIFLILFTICYYYLDLRNYDGIIKKTLIEWGKIAFSLYYIQFIMIIVGLMFFSLILNLLNLLVPFKYHFIVVILIFFLLLEIFIILWKKFNFLFGIEWLMNFFSHKSLFHKENI